MTTFWYALAIAHVSYIILTDFSLVLNTYFEKICSCQQQHQQLCPSTWSATTLVVVVGVYYANL